MRAPTIFQQLDTPILDTAVTTIPGSGGSPVQVIASVKQDCQQILVTSQIGSMVGLYVNGTLKAVIPPGWADWVGVDLSVGDVIALRSMAATDITGVSTDAGLLNIQLAN